MDLTATECADPLLEMGAWHVHHSVLRAGPVPRTQTQQVNRSQPGVCGAEDLILDVLMSSPRGQLLFHDELLTLLAKTTTGFFFFEEF